MNLRLAERQGLLQGRYLSVVQTRALEILNFMDTIERTREEQRQLKLALISSGRFEPRALFPDSFQGESDEDAVESDGGDGFEGETIEWLSPSDMEGGFEEYEKLMAEISANSTGTVDGDAVTVTSWR